MGKKFIKKSVTIEAVQFTGKNTEEILMFIGDAAIAQAASKGIIIKTLEGTMLACNNDWIIKGIKGEFYPCKPDIFDATYESIKEIF